MLSFRSDELSAEPAEKVLKFVETLLRGQHELMISLNPATPIDQMEFPEDVIFGFFAEESEDHLESDIEQGLELVKRLLDGKDDWTILWKPKRQREAMLQIHSLDDTIRWASADHRIDDLGGKLTEVFVAQERSRRYSVEEFLVDSSSPPSKVLPSNSAQISAVTHDHFVENHPPHSEESADAQRHLFEKDDMEAGPSTIPELAHDPPLLPRTVFQLTSDDCRRHSNATRYLLDFLKAPVENSTIPWTLSWEGDVGIPQFVPATTKRRDTST